MFDQETKQLERDRASLLSAVKNGLHSDAVITELSAVLAKLELRNAEREALVPAPIESPEDLHTLNRNFVANITAILSDEGVAGRVNDKLHALLDQVIISWNAEMRRHKFEMRGDLLELIGKPQGQPLGGDAELEKFAKVSCGSRQPPNPTCPTHDCVVVYV